MHRRNPKSRGFPYNHEERDFSEKLTPPLPPNLLNSLPKDQEITAFGRHLWPPTTGGYLLKTTTFIAAMSHTLSLISHEAGLLCPHKTRLSNQRVETG